MKHCPLLLNISLTIPPNLIMRERLEWVPSRITADSKAGDGL